MISLVLTYFFVEYTGNVTLLLFLTFGIMLFCTILADSILLVLLMDLLVSLEVV